MVLSNLLPADDSYLANGNNDDNDPQIVQDIAAFEYKKKENKTQSR